MLTGPAPAWQKVSLTEMAGPDLHGIRAGRRQPVEIPADAVCGGHRGMLVAAPRALGPPHRTARPRLRCRGFGHEPSADGCMIPQLVPAEGSVRTLAYCVRTKSWPDSRPKSLDDPDRGPSDAVRARRHAQPRRSRHRPDGVRARLALAGGVTRSLGPARAHEGMGGSTVRSPDRRPDWGRPPLARGPSTEQGLPPSGADRDRADRSPPQVGRPPGTPAPVPSRPVGRPAPTPGCRPGALTSGFAKRARARSIVRGAR